MTAGSDLDRFLDAAGGAGRWTSVRSLDVEFRSGGAAFATKGVRTALHLAHAAIDLETQQATVSGALPTPWRVSFAGTAELQQRYRALRAGWRRVRWTPDDVGAFAAIALWTYLALPREIALGRVTLARPRRPRELELVFPSTVATHSQRQTLHLDAAGNVIRHDYTARGFGPHAHAAQAVRRHEEHDGLRFGCSRSVTPRAGRRALPLPRLVWIELQAISVSQGSTCGDPAAAAVQQQRRAWDSNPR